MPNPTIVPITQPRVPFLNPETGFVSMPWYLFLLSLSQSQGGNSISLDDVQKGPPSLTVDEINAIIDKAAGDITPSQDGLLAQIAELQKQVNALALQVRPELGTMSQLQQGNVPWLTFNTTPAGMPTTFPGTLYWDEADGNQTLNLVMAGGVTTQQIGEEQYYRIKADSTITEGQVIMFTGTVGASGGLRGAPATGLTATQNEYIMGVATQYIANNGWGYVTWFGEVKGVNTTGGAEAWVDGQILYYNPAVAGGLTKTVPPAPNPKVIVASVVHAATSGILFVRPTFGSPLGATDSNVEITGLADGTLDTDAVNKLQVTTLTAASVQLANDWAQKISDFVTGSDNSAKSWAIGGTGNGDPTAGSAKEWATSTSVVDGGFKGALGYANDASASASSASGFSTAASGYAATALGHSNTASGFATAASESATSAADTLFDFRDKYVNNAGAGIFPASGNFSGRVAWSGSAFGVYNGSGWDALTSTPAASETVQGIIEIATQAETNTGTDDARAVTPLKLKTTPLTLPKNVQTVAKTDTFTTTSTSYTDLTGMTFTITPITPSTLIPIFPAINGTPTGSTVSMGFKVLRGATDVLLGDAASARTRAQAAMQGTALANATLVAIDSPATTSATTYKIQCILGSAGTGYINRDGTDNDSAARVRSASTLTVMEIQ